MTYKFNKYSLSILAVSIISFVLLGNVQNVLSFLNGACLWAEDGNVFINQAFEIGVESVWTPYNGYLLLFPRIFALIASIFNLSYTPFIFISGWYLSYLYMTIMIADFLYVKNTKSYLILLVLLATGFQPHMGETYFNITNAQWFLSIVLTIRLLMDKYLKPSIANFSILLLAGLTGPFSIFVIPLIFLKILLKKDIKENWFGYLIVLMTASIQIYFMLNSNRFGGETNHHIYEWLICLYIYFTFGGHGFVTILSLFFWLIFLYSILKSIRNKSEFSDKFLIDGMLILLTATLFYSAGLIAVKSNPTVLNPTGAGSRYFIVPYSLTILSLPILIRQKKIVLLILFTFFLISCLQFSKYTKFIRSRSNLNYQSYAWLSSKVEDIIIPINPQWAKFPGWHIAKTSKPIISKSRKTTIDNKDAYKYNLTFQKKKDQVSNNNRYFIFEIPKKCLDSKHIGFEVNIFRENEGWAKIFWTKRGEGNNNVKSYKRYYSAGKIKMQFAFKNKGFNELKFIPSEKSGALKINAFVFICE